MLNYQRVFPKLSWTVQGDVGVPFFIECQDREVPVVHLAPRMASVISLQVSRSTG